jgi:hypothetical protein
LLSAILFEIFSIDDRNSVGVFTSASVIVIFFTVGTVASGSIGGENGFDGKSGSKANSEN